MEVHIHIEEELGRRSGSSEEGPQLPLTSCKFHSGQEPYKPGITTKGGLASFPTPLGPRCWVASVPGLKVPGILPDRIPVKATVFFNSRLVMV